MAEILDRKLARVKKDAKLDATQWEWLSIRAVASLYGVDIMQDNAKELGISRSKWYTLCKGA